jgi:hypothetical protein
VEQRAGESLKEIESSLADLHDASVEVAVERFVEPFLHQRLANHLDLVLDLEIQAEAMRKGDVADLFRLNQYQNVSGPLLSLRLFWQIRRSLDYKVFGFRSNLARHCVIHC